MKKKIRNVLTALMIANVLGCGNSQQNVYNNSKTDTTTDQTVTKKSGSATPKITPCLWVDKDAKAVVDYYLSIFKNGKMKEYHQYKNPPEAKEQGGQDSFETAVVEMGDIEFNILAAGDRKSVV